MGFWFYWLWREIGECYICVILDGLSFIQESVQTRSRLIYSGNRFEQLFFSFNINNEFDINITKSNFKSNPNPSIKLILVLWKKQIAQTSKLLSIQENTSEHLFRDSSTYLIRVIPLIKYFSIKNYIYNLFQCIFIHKKTISVN